MRKGGGLGGVDGGCDLRSIFMGYLMMATSWSDRMERIILIRVLDSHCAALWLGVLRYVCVVLD